MAFIVSKVSKKWGKERKLYYLVKNYREGNKIRRNAILRLGEGSNLSEALLCIQDKENDFLLDTTRLENRIDCIKKGDRTAYYPFLPYYKQLSRANEILNMSKLKLDKLLREKDYIKQLIRLYPNCSAKES